MSESARDDTYVRLPWFGLGRLIPYLSPYSGIMICMIVLGVAGSACDIAVPVFFSYALDHFVEQKTLERLPLFAAFYAAVIIFQVDRKSVV